jgi:tetratricopeptide (TPR) repeat protein
VVEWYSQPGKVAHALARALLACGALAALLLVCGSAPLQAQASEAKHYERLIHDAVSEFATGNYAEARALFEQAHALTPSARTLRGLGMTSFELRHYVQAQGELSAALTDKRKPLTRAQRDEVTALLERARNYVGVVECDVTPTEATLLVDGSPAGDRKLTLDLGEYHLTVRAPGYKDFELRVNVEGGRTQQLKIELKPVELSPSKAELATTAQPASSRTSATTEVGEPRTPSVFQRWWFWTAVGVLVAGGVTAGVLVSSHSGTRPLENGDVGKAVVTLRVSP